MNEDGADQQRSYRTTNRGDRRSVPFMDNAHPSADWNGLEAPFDFHSGGDSADMPKANRRRGNAAGGANLHFGGPPRRPLDDAEGAVRGHFHQPSSSRVALDEPHVPIVVEMPRPL